MKIWGWCSISNMGQQAHLRQQVLKLLIAFAVVKTLLWSHDGPRALCYSENGFSHIRKLPFSIHIMVNVEHNVSLC